MYWLSSSSSGCGITDKAQMGEFCSTSAHRFGRVNLEKVHELSCLGWFSLLRAPLPRPSLWNQNIEMIPSFTSSNGPLNLLPTRPCVCLGWSRCAEPLQREAEA